MSAVKYLLDNSNIFVISVEESIHCLFIQFEIFLVLRMMNDFQMKPGHFYISKSLDLILSFYFSWIFLTLLGRGRSGHLVTAGWRWRPRSFVWPTLTPRQKTLATDVWVEVQGPTLSLQHHGEGASLLVGRGQRPGSLPALPDTPVGCGAS